VNNAPDKDDKKKGVSAKLTTMEVVHDVDIEDNDP
jgi:hypothetical protein